MRLFGKRKPFPLTDEEVIREAGRWDFLLEEQRYHAYPARYRRNVHWSITGTCNLRCRHCFMSAPHAKHGMPSTRFEKTSLQIVLALLNFARWIVCQNVPTSPSSGSIM